MPDLDVAAQVSAAVSGAVGAYGAGVLSRVEDVAADGTVGVGLRVLRRILGRGPAPALDRAVYELAEASDPDEVEDAKAALRLEVRKILKEDPGLRAELLALLPTGAAASGDGSIAIGGDSSGINSTGNNSINIQER